jgi:hypothetical protein
MTWSHLFSTAGLWSGSYGILFQQFRLKRATSWTLWSQISPPGNSGQTNSFWWNSTTTRSQYQDEFCGNVTASGRVDLYIPRNGELNCYAMVTNLHSLLQGMVHMQHPPLMDLFSRQCNMNHGQLTYTLVLCEISRNSHPADLQLICRFPRIFAQR